MEKAYDRIEWDFLSYCLQSMNFHPTWIAWIQECISMASYSLIINNEACGFFTPARGLRQGDLLSPYLFIVCMDLLAQQLYSHSLDPKTGISIKLVPQTEKILCLFCADDGLLFCKASSQTAFTLKASRLFLSTVWTISQSS